MTHDELYSQFAAEIRSLIPIAQAWHESRIADARRFGRLPRHFGPPASHPRVIEVLRRYYFACDRLNREIEDKGGGEWIGPAVFLLEDQGGRFRDVWAFVTELPFLPIGYDQDGNPV